MSARLYRVSVELSVLVLAESEEDAIDGAAEAAEENIAGEETEYHAAEVTADRARGDDGPYGLPWGMSAAYGDAPTVGEILRAMSEGVYEVTEWRTAPGCSKGGRKVTPPEPLRFTIEPAPGGFMSTGHGVSVESSTAPGVMLGILKALGELPEVPS